MKFTRMRISAILSFVLAGSALVLVQAPAEAAITSTSITSPANGTRYMVKTAGPVNVAVTGTTNGTTGDFVDIRCYEVGSSSWQNAVSNVPVQANGTFATTMATSEPYGRCRLRAVPHLYPAGNSLANFAGPVVTTEYVQTRTITSGPNAGKVTNFYVEFMGKYALNDYGSATHSGIWDARLTDAAGFSSNYIWYSNGAMVQNEFEGRGYLRIDGRNAYGPSSASDHFPENANLPQLTWSVTRDTKTGATTIKESNPFVWCPIGATTYPPSESACPKFIPAGVRLDRTIVTSDGGLQVRITDVWRSTDGKSHLISPYFLQEIAAFDQVADADTVSGLKLPWSGKFTTFTTSKTLPGPTSLPASMFWRTNNAAPNGNSLHPRGAVSFDFPLSVYWDDNDDIVLKAKTFKLVSGAPRTYHHSYVIGTSDEAVAAKAAANENRMD